MTKKMIKLRVEKEEKTSPLLYKNTFDKYYMFFFWEYKYWTVYIEMYI